MRDLQRNDFDGNSLLVLSVSQDVKNSSWRALHLGQPGLGMEKEYFDQVCQHIYYGLHCHGQTGPSRKMAVHYFLLSTKVFSQVDY